MSSTLTVASQVIARMSDYEIGVYNKNVRDAIRGGEVWKNDMGISAEFENTLYFPIRNAASIEEVERRAAKSFPAKLGYVIECIMLVRSSD